MAGGGSSHARRETNDDLQVAVEEVSPLLLKGVPGFCSDKAMQDAAFVKVLWSIVLRQLVDSELSFGFQDLRNRDCPKVSANALQIIPASISSETTLAALIQSQRQLEIEPVSRESAPAHRTAVFLLQETEEWEPMVWLEKHKGSKGDYYEAVLLVEYGHRILPRLRLLYCPTHLSVRGAANFASTIARAVEEMLVDPNRHTGDLNLVSPRNLQDIAQWNSYVRETPVPASIVDVISQQMEESPHAQAVCAWDAELTYTQLNNTTMRLAAHLRLLGVGPQILVAVCAERSTLVLIAELAILRAGGGFVPLDISQPAARLRYIIKQTKASIMVVSENFHDRLHGFVETMVTISHDMLSRLQLPQVPIPPVQADSTAYVLFTSGTTGQPKGCVGDHAALVSVCLHVQALKINVDSRVLQFSSYSFGVSFSEMYCTLTVGGTVCIPSESDRLDRLAEVINEMRITWALFMPSTAETLDPASCGKHFQTLLLAGEPMKWAGICCVSRRIRSPADVKSIGTSPTANLWLADPADHNRLAPVGAVAELLVEGPELARGYLLDETKTAERYVENPPWLYTIPDREGGEFVRRVYKTGDLVQYQPDGSLRYIARKDTQVKIRGQRVELQDIEHCLRAACPAHISKVIVETAIVNDGAGVLVVAFLYSSSYDDDGYAANDEILSSITASGILQFRTDMTAAQQALATVLPDYMRPSVYLPIKRLPLTITRKANRRVLREMVSGLSRRALEAYHSDKPECVVPSSVLEKRLHETFGCVLKLAPDTFGIDDSFLKLGGDLVLAMRLVSLSSRQHCDLRVAQILEHQTIRKLVGKIQDLHDQEIKPKDKVEKAIPPFTYDLNQLLSRLGVLQHDVEDVYPCSPIQEGILLRQVRYPKEFIMRFAWEIVSVNPALPVDLHGFQIAWKEVCQYHPMLRSRFLQNVTANELAVQVVLNQDSVKLPAIFCDPHLDPQRLLDHNKAQSHGTATSELTIFHGIGCKVYAVLEINHVMVDVMSISIIMQDLALFYRGGDVQSQPCLYRDFVAYLSGLNMSVGLSFWKKELSDLTPCIFPKLNNTQNSTDVELHNVQFGLPDMSRCRAFCQEQCITLATLFKLAWGLVIRCFTGNNDVCFTYMTAGRDVPLDGLECAVGPFINQLICRIQLGQDKTSLLQTLQGIQNAFIRAMEHQNITLGEIYHELGEPAEEALFNTGLAFSSHAMRENDDFSSGIKISEIGIHDLTSYGIVLVVEDSGGADVRCRLNYKTELLSDEQGQQLVQTLTHTLAHIVEEPTTKLSTVNLFHSGDQVKVAEWNSREPEFEERCVHHLFHKCYIAQPSALAVDSWDGRWTYAELDNISSRLALRLQTRGIATEVFTPLCIMKGRWVPVALLSVIKAGGAFCLLDPTYPVSHLRGICQELKSPIVLTCSQQVDLARQLGKNVVVIDRDESDDDNSNDFKQLSLSSHEAITPSTALYAVFTSGSTGKPKGIVIEHGSFASSVRATGHLTQLNQTDRVLQFASYAFDINVYEHLAPLLVGACLCIPSATESKDTSLADIFQRYAITHAIMVPSLTRLMRPEQVPSLRALIMGGEPVLATDIQMWAPHTLLLNMYGPAETTAVATANHCTAASSDNGVIGTALPSACTWIVDSNDHERLVPVGAVGELLIEGPIVARGYVKNLQGSHNPVSVPPFVAPPRWLPRFRSENKLRRFYQTGDLVRYTPDGRLQFLGRKDTQVKIRGQRVELGAIEDYIRTFYRGERNAMVEVVRFGSMSMNLVGFIEGDDERRSQEKYRDRPLFAPHTPAFETEASALSAHLKTVLPKYMVPTAFIPLTHVPVTNTHKVNRKQLHQTLEALSQSEKDALFRVNETDQVQPPTTEMEVQLQTLLAQVLQLPSERIGADSDFFLLGGDSLLAMKLVQAARVANLVVPIADIFQHSRLSGLAAAVYQSASTIKIDGTPMQTDTSAPFSLIGKPVDAQQIQTIVAEQCRLFQTEHIEDVYPCIPLQEDLILRIVDGQSSRYTVRLVYKLPADTVTSRLQTAWEATIAASPILRTRIIHDAAYGALQVVLRPNEDIYTKWLVSDTVEGYLRQDTVRPMALGQPFVRFGLVHNSQQCLIITLHHSIYDAAAMQLLLQQVQVSYKSQQMQPLPKQPFTPFVQYLQSQQEEEVKAFWTEELQGFGAGPAFSLLSSSTKSGAPPIPTAVIEHEVLISAAHRTATLSNMMRLAWAIVVSHYPRSQDIVFGAVLTGRNARVSNIEQLTGPTTATVPFRVQFTNGEISLAEASGLVQSRASQMIPFEQTGLRCIRSLSDEAAAACEFQSLMIVQQPEDENKRDSTLFELSRLDEDRAAFASYVLVLECQLPATLPGNALARVHYDPRHLRSGQAAWLIEHFRDVLNLICEDPGRKMREVEAIVSFDALEE